MTVTIRLKWKVYGGRRIFSGTFSTDIPKGLPKDQEEARIKAYIREVLLGEDSSAEIVSHEVVNE